MREDCRNSNFSTNLYSKCDSNFLFFFQALANKKRKTRQIFIRAEKYVKSYRAKERDEIRLMREAKKRGNFYIPGEAKLAFVIRIRGINRVAPKVRKTLQLLRLRQINNGVFVRLNKVMELMPFNDFSLKFSNPPLDIKVEKPIWFIQFYVKEISNIFWFYMNIIYRVS